MMSDVSGHSALIRLLAEPNHTFRFGEALIADINLRMDRLPEWKRANFNARYFVADEEFLSESLALKQSELGLTVYLRPIFEDERGLERGLRELAGRPDIALRRPVTPSDWHGWVYKGDSPLGLRGGKAYEEAADEQATICGGVFRRQLSVVTGSAGTWKDRGHRGSDQGGTLTEGEGASILVLAPTGKAADRAREVFGRSGLKSVEAITVHSFLASRGWLNKNLTFKRSGGKQIAVGTVVLDEASMLDLELAAALFRAIDWPQVRRLVLVGDAGQLPPIGRGRVFADVLAWLASEQHDSLGRLQRNLRQLLNQVENKGCAIVALSELFVVDIHDILEMRYGLDGQHPRTLDEVGRTFNVTRERVRQIENQCLKKLQALAERRSSATSPRHAAASRRPLDSAR